MDRKGHAQRESALQRRPAARMTNRGRSRLLALASVALIATVARAVAVTVSVEAVLSGAGEAPPNDSAATGLMRGTFDRDTRRLAWTVTYSGLSSLPIGAEFHGPVPWLGRPPEETAPAQVATPGDLKSPIRGVGTLDDIQTKDLMAGRWYFNLHSRKFPSGEIRGPVVVK